MNNVGKTGVAAQIAKAREAKKEATDKLNAEKQVLNKPVLNKFGLKQTGLVAATHGAVGENGGDGDGRLVESGNGLSGDRSAVAGLASGAGAAAGSAVGSSPSVTSI